MRPERKVGLLRPMDGALERACEEMLDFSSARLGDRLDGLVPRSGSASGTSLKRGSAKRESLSAFRGFSS